MDVLVYALAKKYVDESLVGGGAIKGKNCTVADISPITGGNRVTFQWTLDNGTVQTGYLDVMNGEQGIQGETGATGPTGRGIVSTKINANEHLIITYDDGTTEDAGRVAGGGGGTSAELEAALDITRTVGGITSGDHYNAGTKLEQIFRDMLNPTDYPTLTNPSASLSATGAKLLEKGATLSTTFTVTFNRGSINPAYGTSGYRSGAATDYALNGGTAQAENTFSVTVDETVTSYQATVNYAAGEQPKDSTGHDYSSPLAAGSVTSNTVSYEFVNAIWANTANISTVAKLSLVSKSAKQKDFNFPAQTVANPEVFDIPASWTVTAVQVKNDLSGAWEDAAAQFTVTDTTHDDAAGTSTAYKRYTFNLGYATGARSVRVKWS